MKFRTQQERAIGGITAWTAVDDDSYDGPGGPGETGSPVGWGSTEIDAIQDLVEQIVERLEDRIDFLRAEKTFLKDEIEQLRSRSTPETPQTSRQDDRGGVFPEAVEYGHGSENARSPRGVQEEVAEYEHLSDQMKQAIDSSVEEARLKCVRRMSDEPHD